MELSARARKALKRSDNRVCIHFVCVLSPSLPAAAGTPTVVIEAFCRPNKSCEPIQLQASLGIELTIVTEKSVQFCICG